MGIGINNALPWKGLKKEMAYFARITKRAPPGTTNALIMGRKTWDSLPPKFRPLKDRTNIVVTRSSTPSEPEPGKHVVNSISEGITLSQSKDISRIFVIGGAEIYKAALEMKEAKRILLTRIKGEFECDAYFPIKLGEDGKGEGWRRRSKEELDGWTGEEVPVGDQEEGGMKYEFEIWERVEQ
ncbi:related to DFR1-dihydrofolate reductase [Phialocephala subalpina]|uniref:Dihydrofolate reductase n=1 Tax=Phialocephala subalpina TaxID=576137 RepID=A0A1L7X905_9HELO|nr:related to DFR1-dihydrofolate reductase [Phialocephala subalpina]